MGDRTSSDRTESRQRDRQDTTRPAAAGAPARSTGPSPTQAIALQRSAGNRVAARVLARWTKHPDEKQRGVMLDDTAAAELLRLNPPQNK
jgi:hypothetical protein